MLPRIFKFPPSLVGKAQGNARNVGLFNLGEHGGKMYIFGGYNGLSREHMNSVYEYDPGKTDFFVQSINQSIAREHSDLEELI